jgi:phosphoglycolate phosphatase-like HAD superfamily hydrolase
VVLNSEQMDKLILFDIDGTLTRVENGYLPFNEAILQTFSIAGDIRTVVPDGNTDQLIVRDIFTQANVEIEIGADRWQQFTANLQASYRQHVVRGKTSVRALPGAVELLKALSVNETFISSVVTGNFEATAEVKLEAAGLLNYLSRGAYASDSEHRPDLPAIAKRRCEVLTGQTIDSDHCVIIGDTPKDLEAARENHMKCLLVGTGRYPVEELLYWQPDGCLADLSDTNAVLTMLANL